MKIAPLGEVRRNLSSIIDGVVADHEPVVITRDKGKPAAVLMSLEDFASYEETRYLLGNPRNARRLLKSIGELEGGTGQEKTLME
jgi:antitoxin YefM